VILTIIYSNATKEKWSKSFIFFKTFRSRSDAFSGVHHTAPQYKDRAWVGVDGGTKGQQLVVKMKAKFKDWQPEHFRSFTEENFEQYYPAEFKEKVNTVLGMPHGPQKQAEKGKLAEEVLRWAMADPVKAEAEFAVCAKEILDYLREISKKLA